MDSEWTSTRGLHSLSTVQARLSNCRRNSKLRLREPTRSSRKTRNWLSWRVTFVHTWRCCRKCWSTSRHCWNICMARCRPPRTPQSLSRPTDRSDKLRSSRLMWRCPWGSRQGDCPRIERPLRTWSICLPLRAIVRVPMPNPKVGDTLLSQLPSHLPHWSRSQMES
jgi:hypothetical protein